MPQEWPHEWIVVAEDSAPNRMILTHLLKKMGFSILEAEDGEIAWNLMKENRDKKIVAVISDIMMPGMDGLELLRVSRSDPHYQQLPFVLVTAVSDKDYIGQAKNLGVDGYILKPVSFQRVAQKLQTIFPNKQFPKLTG